MVPSSFLMKSCAGWDVSVVGLWSYNSVNKLSWIGMGTTHAWESYGDGVAPDIQAVAKGLGGGFVQPSLHFNKVFLTL
jgi:hypothetical protein